MDIKYRKLRPGESAKYRQIRLEALQKFPESFGSSYEEESARPKLAFEINIEQQTPDKFIVGAFDGNKLIGICGFSQEDRRKARHRGLIVQMYIQPKYQGHRLGLPLIQAVIAEAFKIAEVEQIVLGVVTNNVSAARTYERAGFKDFGLQPGYFKIDQKCLDQRLMILERKHLNG